MRCLALILSLAGLFGLGAMCHAAEPLPPPKRPLILTICGNIKRTNSSAQAQFDWDMLEALGKAPFTTGSEFSSKPQLFESVRLRAVLARAITPIRSETD